MQRESVERESSRTTSPSKPENSTANSIAPLHPLLRLQRTAGNRAVQRMLGHGLAQAKLQAGSAGGLVQPEGDRTAGRVRDVAAASNRPAITKATPAPAPTLQRSASTTESAPSQESAQQEKSSQPGLTAGFAVPRPPDEGALPKNKGAEGKRLDSAIRSSMGAQFGHDFSGVRIHTDAPSARVADNFDAHAVTMGSNIYFERGGYKPETQQGRSVLAHELTHVVQNERGSGGARASETKLEAEADSAGARVAAGHAVNVRLASRAPVLKMSRPVKTLLGVGLGAAIGSVVGAIGLAAAQGFGATISGDLANDILLGAAGAGAVVGGLIGFFSKEKEQELPQEETETDEEKNEDFQTRFQRWLKKGLNNLHGSTCRFPSGEWRYDDRYWERVEGEKMMTYKPKDIPPALAVDRLFQNLDRWDFDCAIYPEVAVIYAYRHTLGTNEFNTKFSDLRIRQHRTSGVPWEVHSVENEGKEAFDKLWDESPVGTKITWTNRSSATDGTDWQNENGIKRIKGNMPDDDRFDAFPIGANLSEKEVKRGLAEAAHDFPRSGDETAKQAYVDAKIYRSYLQLLKNA